FFFIHHKPTDSAGEDGNFGAKMAAIEQVDALVPRIANRGPQVLCVTGDHATPSQLRSHSWHPVPFLLWGPAVGVDGVDRFHEEAARAGAFGLQQGKNLMALMLGAGGRLARFGP
ncbi:MAG: 2,3-bisphosphoglycerate-independent phosphoglycerate mutase, partial [Actinomycetota bacterium]